MARALKDPAMMTAGQINKELDRLDGVRREITDAFIASGRGHERPSEYLRMTDPLSMRARENSDRYDALHHEITMRYGPGAPHRLPTGQGFKPRKKPDGSSNYGDFGGDVQTIHKFLEKYRVTMTVTEVDSNPNMDSPDRMTHWRCTLRCGRNSTTITYSMGSGTSGEPEVADVLNCMSIDASTAKNARSWEDWAQDFGMETEIEDENTGRMRPNPKAKKIYAACLKEHAQLESLLTPAGAKELMYETEPL